ncbi:MAG: hypothetical protein KCHDKBKB_02687 [Elusimicrobia bacterium]|nr:hypothetical protein [Elusimicrobiota bacterium]
MAHEYSFRPVRAELTQDENQIRVLVRSQADYWLEGVLFAPPLSPLPGTDWPSAYQERAREYLQKSFRLSIDQQPLMIQTLVCRFVQEPFRPRDSQVVFEMLYSLEGISNLSERSLNISAQFFSECKKLEADVHSDEEFLTILTFRGSKERQVQLPLDHPDVTVPIRELSRSTAQVRKERIFSQIRKISNIPAVWMFLGALVFLFWPRGKNKYRVYAGCLLLVFSIYKLAVLLF